MVDEERRETRDDTRLDALTKRMQLLLSQIKTSTDAGADLLELQLHLKKQEEHQKYNYSYLSENPAFFGSVPRGAPPTPQHSRQLSNGAISFTINATRTYASSSSSRTAVNITSPPVFFSCSDSPSSSPSFGFHQGTPTLDYYYPQHVDNIPTPPTDTILRPVDANFDTSLVSPHKALSTTEATVPSPKQTTRHHRRVPKRLYGPNTSNQIIHSNPNSSETTASSSTVLSPHSREKSDDSIQVVDEPAYLMIGRPASFTSTTHSRSSSFGSSKASGNVSTAIAASGGSFRIHHYGSPHRRRRTRAASRMRRRRHTEIVVHAPIESAIYSATHSMPFGAAGVGADAVGSGGSGGGNVTNCSWWTWFWGGGRRRGDRWEKRGKGVGVWVGKDAKKVKTIAGRSESCVGSSRKNMYLLPQLPLSSESPVRKNSRSGNTGDLNRSKSAAFSATRTRSGSAAGCGTRSLSLSFRRLWAKERPPNSLNVREILNPTQQLCNNPQLKVHRNRASSFAILQLLTQPTQVTRNVLQVRENQLVSPYCPDDSNPQDIPILAFVGRASLYSSSSSCPTAPSIRWSTTTDEDNQSNSDLRQLSEPTNSNFNSGKKDEIDGDGLVDTGAVDESEIVYVGNSQNKTVAFKQSGEWWNHPGVVGRGLATGSVGVF
ncbi:hypothetical protein HK100_009286 [Physocladia obscura]|uniref:Uncharacterized protein n=1 Tax=Physocladia obscura TaxID=109957 RepID=A0AAD5T5Y4_9FUNG|nr:hypothetical protein HK100_009286 [Physocladia obscura]